MRARASHYYYYYLTSLFARAVQWIVKKFSSIMKQQMAINRFALLLVDKKQEEGEGGGKPREREREERKREKLVSDQSTSIRSG